MTSNDAELPDVPDDDLPNLPESGAASLGGSDEDVARKIARRSSPLGRIVTVLCIGGAAFLAWTYVQQNAAKEARWSVWEKANTAANNDHEAPAFLAAIREDLSKTTFEDVKVSYIIALGIASDAAAVPSLIAELKNPSSVVRGESARALAYIGLPAAESAKSALMEALPTTDIGHRARLVWALAKLREARAADDIVKEFVDGRLESQEDWDAKIVTDALGIARLSSDPILRHPSAKVRALVASALAEAGTSEVVDPLIKMIEDANVETPGESDERKRERTVILREAAAGLGRTGDPRAARPLFEVLTRRADVRYEVLDAIRRSTAAPNIAAMLPGATDVGIRREMIKMLRSSHDARIADVLVAEIARPDVDADIKEEAAFALAELGDPRGAGALLVYAQGEDNPLANQALDALRALRAPVDVGAMEALMEERVGRRATILRVLAASGSQEAGPVLVKALATDDIETAILALGELRYEPAYKKIVEMTKRPRDIDFTHVTAAHEEIYRNRRKAVEALGYYGRNDAAPILVKLIEDPAEDLRIREVAGEALGQVATEPQLREALAKVRNSAIDEVVRRAYVRALWQKPVPALTADLLGVMESDAPADVRRAAALAVGYAARPESDERLIALLSSDTARRDAAIAILLGGSVEAARALMPRLESDRDVRDMLETALVGNDSDQLSMITAPMFESGQVYRRLRAAVALRSGTNERQRMLSAWSRYLERLRQGWLGPNGLSAQQIRERLYTGLTSNNQEDRELCAEVLGDMDERGLLIRARDEGKDGSAEAREKLRRLNTRRS